jgi:hypothetical protein
METLCSVHSSHALRNLSLILSGEEQHCTVAAVRETAADYHREHNIWGTGESRVLPVQSILECCSGFTLWERHPGLFEYHADNFSADRWWVFLTLFKLTGSLWCRQSQQSFNMLTPFYFLSHSLHVSAPMGHLQVRYTIIYFKEYF